jgi:hypothetical protein
MNWLIFIFWPLAKLGFNTPYLNKLLSLDLYDSEKITDNFVSATHSIGSIILNALYLYTSKEYLINISCMYSYSYFIYDTYLISFKKTGYSYSIHHISALIIIEDMLNNINRDFLVYLFIIAEISNLPNYYVYHKLKCDSSNDLKYTKLLQLLWFSYFRIYVYSYCIKSVVYSVHHKLTTFMLLLVYFAGAYWSFGQIKGVYALFNKKALIKKTV